MKISGQFSIETNSWKVGIILKIFVNIAEFSGVIFSVYVTLSGNLQTNIYQNHQINMRRFFFYAVCGIVISGYFGIENYIWRLGIVQNF